MLHPRCTIPFTFGLLRPVILMPASAGSWPSGRLTSGITHELAHIRRQDLLLQIAGYIVCTLFWFVPPLWVAYSEMLREAETCCDQQVINRGIKGSVYAHDMLDLARSCAGRILIPCIPSAIGRKRMFNERIKRVLTLRARRLSWASGRPARADGLRGLPVPHSGAFRPGPTIAPSTDRSVIRYLGQFRF